MTKALILLIRFWQHTFSPDHAGGLVVFGRCKFYPSCSDYAVSSLRQYGLFYGSMFLFLRIAKCNPFVRGGYDPVKDWPPAIKEIKIAD